jgi:hypothetical protein
MYLEQMKYKLERDVKIKLVLRSRTLVSLRPSVRTIENHSTGEKEAWNILPLIRLQQLKYLLGRIFGKHNVFLHPFGNPVHSTNVKTITLPDNFVPFNNTMVTYTYEQKTNWTITENLRILRMIVNKENYKNNIIHSFLLNGVISKFLKARAQLFSSHAFQRNPNKSGNILQTSELKAKNLSLLLLWWFWTFNTQAVITRGHYLFLWPQHTFQSVYLHSLLL